MSVIDINCDMGESTPLHQYDIKNDFALLEFISSMNLACGFHAGDANTMHRLVEAAVEKETAIGAHPGFPDRENFGRTPIKLGADMIYDIVIYQLGALQGFVKLHGARLHHVKPHGALYNLASVDMCTADAICRAIRDFDEELILYALSGSIMISTARQLGLQAVSEVFADRTYQPDGSLTPRTQSGAVIEDTNTSLQQVLQMLREGTVNTVNGKVAIKAETLCIHGDGKHALEFAKNIYKLLQQHEVAICKPGRLSG